MRALSIICIIISCTTVADAKVDCTKASESLPKSADAKNVFQDLHTFYKKYGACLDGESAESSAAFVTDAFAKSWNNLNSFHKLAKQDPGFKKFALTSFEPNVTAQESTVAKIIEQTKKSCPKKLATLCSEIRKACEDSLKPERFYSLKSNTRHSSFYKNIKSSENFMNQFRNLSARTV